MCAIDQTGVLVGSDTITELPDGAAQQSDVVFKRSI